MQNLKDIEATYEHKYTTRFIIDKSSGFSRLREMELSKSERLFIVAFLKHGIKR